MQHEKSRAMFTTPERLVRVSVLRMLLTMPSNRLLVTASVTGSTAVREAFFTLPTLAQ
jgi:hypothetical protein